MKISFLSARFTDTSASKGSIPVVLALRDSAINGHRVSTHVPDRKEDCAWMTA